MPRHTDLVQCRRYHSTHRGNHLCLHQRSCRGSSCLYRWDCTRSFGLNCRCSVWGRSRNCLHTRRYRIVYQRNSADKHNWLSRSMRVCRHPGPYTGSHKKYWDNHLHPHRLWGCSRTCPHTGANTGTLARHCTRTVHCNCHTAHCSHHCHIACQHSWVDTHSW